MRRLALAPTLVCVFLTPPTAFALGVGEIELQSALNQPLDAEIPLRGVPAERSDDIIVTLASEKAFREVGLSRPHSLTRLEFGVATREGTPYIQVSSSKPISEPFLNFLIEVDAPDGNLLREYTVLLDPPVFASEEASSGEGTDAETAESPAAEEATDEAAMSGAVGSAPAAESEAPSPAQDMAAESPDQSAPAPAPDESEPIPSADPVEADAPAPAAASKQEGEFGDTPLFLEVAREQEEAERRQREQRLAEQQSEDDSADEDETVAPAPTAEAPRVPDEYGEVKQGETLWDIAAQLRQGDTTVQQMMLALLRYNPQAFEDGNINRLKEGYVLRVPDAGEAQSVAAQQAIAQVREQNGLWREWRQAVGQGQATQVAAAESREAADAGGPANGDSGDSAAGTSDSRLDIVGSDEGGATSDESASATGNGADASEELKLAREELASVRAEREDLADRVAQLEDTVEKMEQLVTVREDQLAKLQSELRELEAETANEDVTAADGQQDGAQQSEDTAVAASTGPQSGDGDQGAGDDGNGEGGAPSAAEGDNVASAEEPAAADGGADAEAETSASDEQQEIATTRTDAPERGWLDTVLGVVGGIGATLSGVAATVLGGGLLSSLLVGATGLLIVAMLLVRRRRAQKAAEEQELAAGIAAVQSNEVAAHAEPSAHAEPVTADADPEPVDEVEASDSLFDDDLDLSDLDADMPESTASSDGDAKDETIDEADVYLAYGLQQQAEDLIRLALQENPQRVDYHEKLLETLFAAGKADDFVAAAHELRQQVDEPPQSARQRIADMGQQIAPQQALFTDAAGAAVETPAAEQAAGAQDLDVELDLRSGSDALSAMSDSDDGAIDLDVAATTASPAGASSDGSGDDDLTFDLSDLDAAGPAAPASSDETTAGQAGSDNGLDFDVAELENDLGLGGDSATTETAPDTVGEASNESEGLDFDLGDLSDFGSSGASESAAAGSSSEPAGSAGDDNGLDFELDDALGLDDSAPTAEPAGNESELDFSEFETAFESVDDGAAGAETDGTSAAAAPADPMTSAPADSPGGDLDAELAVGGGDETSDVVDFDLASLEDGDTGEASAENGLTDGDSSVGPTDEDGEDLATMLDLAKAYIDMGDADSASNALEEVIAGGSEEQRAEARSLLETVQ